MKTNSLIVGIVATGFIGIAVAAYFLYKKPSEPELSGDLSSIASIAVKTCGGKDKVKRVHSEGFECL